MRTMQTPALRCIFRNTGGRGGKRAKPNKHAGSQRVRQWGQSEGRLWAKWGQSYIVRIFTHSLLSASSVFSTWPAQPTPLADAFARCWNWAQRGLSLAPIPSPAAVDNFCAADCLNVKQSERYAKSMIQFNIPLKRTKLCNNVCSTTGVMLTNAYVKLYFVCFRVILKKA